MSRAGARALAALAPALLAACGGGSDAITPPPTPPAARLVLAGRAERGGTLAVAAHGGGDSIPGARLRLAVDPADAATVGDDGTLALRRVGTFTLTATLPDGRVASAVQTVVAPPALALDLVVDGNRDVYRVALDGGDLVRLTTALGDDASPTAAEGTVVFTSYRHGQGELFALPAAGGAERRLTATAESEGSAALSPDGRRLAFVRPVQGVARVWVADADAGNARRLTADTPLNAGAPEASPAWGVGGWLAFTGTAGGQADVALASTASLPASVAVLAGSAPAPDVEPAWDAAGARLAFVSTRDGGPALYVAGAAGGPATRVTAVGTSVSQPAWTADGRIVLVVRRGTSATLAWLDPAVPGVLHDVPLPGRDPGHPAILR